MKAGKVLFRPPEPSQALRKFVMQGNEPSPHFYLLPVVAVVLFHIQYPGVKFFCSKCKRDGRGTQEMKIKGWPVAPRVIWSREGRIYLFQVFLFPLHVSLTIFPQRRYFCSICNWNPRAMNPEILQQLPVEAQLQCSFLLTKRSGVTLDVLEEYPALVDLGIGPSGIFQLHRENLTKRFLFFRNIRSFSYLLLGMRKMK